MAPDIAIFSRRLSGTGSFLRCLPIDWRQSRDWHFELPSPEGTLEVVLPLGENEEEGLEGMDNCLWDPSLKRYCLVECVSLAGGLQFVPLAGAGAACLS